MTTSGGAGTLLSNANLPNYSVLGAPASLIGSEFLYNSHRRGSDLRFALSRCRRGYLMYKRATTPSSVHKKHNTQRYGHRRRPWSIGPGLRRLSGNFALLAFSELRRLGILRSSHSRSSRKLRHASFA